MTRETREVGRETIKFHRLSTVILGTVFDNIFENNVWFYFELSIEIKNA